MAKIIKTSAKRKMIRISTDDILSIITQYQTLTCGKKNYDEIRQILNQNAFYLPEDL